MNLVAFLLAQTTTQTKNGGSPSIMGVLPLALFGGLIAFMLLTSRSQKKKEQKQHEDMLAGMSKNDRVLTVGGVVGTVVSVKENEIILKVDESTNTKMTFVRSAIRRVFTDGQDVQDNAS